MRDKVGSVLSIDTAVLALVLVRRRRRSPAGGRPEEKKNLRISQARLSLLPADRRSLVFSIKNGLLTSQIKDVFFSSGMGMESLRR